MRQYRFRVARVAVVAVVVVGLARARVRAGPSRPRPLPPGPVRQLSMEDAISLALQNNLSLRVERINPELQDLAIAQARTVWTPNLTGVAVDHEPDEPDQRLLLRRDRQADAR